MARLRVIGDETTAIAIAAGAAQASLPVDFSSMDRNYGKIVLTVTGSGTVKLSARVSPEGRYDFASLGDLATGLTAGTHTLNVSGLTYGHFYEFTITETGGASGVSVVLVVDGHNTVGKRQVLTPCVVTLATDNSVRGNLWQARSTLRKMGYYCEAVVVDRTTLLPNRFVSSGGPYDFILMPRVYTGWSSGFKYADFAKGLLAIPTFYTGQRDFLTDLGANRVTAAGYRWTTWGTIDIPWNVPEFQTIGGRTDVFPLIYSQGSATNYGAWKIVGPANTVYVEGGAETQSLLPVLMQIAVTEGKISPPPRKLDCWLDLDDTPEGLSTLADIQAIYALQETHGIPATWGIHAETPFINNYAQPIIDYIAARTPDKGGLIYLIDHAADDWRGPKATIDSNFTSWQANMEARGLSTKFAGGKPNWGYRYFNTNQIGENGVQLMSPQFSKASDVAGTTAKNGYGHSCFRTSTGVGDGTSRAVRSPKYQPFHGIVRGMVSYGGINHISSAQISLSTTTNVDLFALDIVTDWLNLGPAFNCPLYLHGSNFYDGHDGGNAPGLIVMETIGKISAACPAIIRNAHPTWLDPGK